MKDIVKKYTNGEVTVVWKPNVCIHSANCFHGLSQVFNPQKRPWVNMEGAGTSAIIEQVKQCPSGALTYYLNENTQKNQSIAGNGNSVFNIEVTVNGPLMVHGDLSVKLPDGTITNKSKVTAFCRCGGSANKPFCDGTHRKNNFKG